MRLLQSAGSTDLFRRLDQPVHEPAEVASRDTAASGGVRFNAERFRRFQVDFRDDSRFVLKILCGDCGIEFGHAEIDGARSVSQESCHEKKGEVQRG